MGGRRRNHRSDDGSTVMTMEEDGFFSRLFFSPGSVDTDVSGSDDDGDESQSEGTLGTRTYCSTVSASETESDMSGSDEDSTSPDLIRFDRELRAKHRGACKNMTVSVMLCFLLVIAILN